MNENLRLPKSFESLSEEMMYTEGGYRAYRTVTVPVQTVRIHVLTYLTMTTIADILSKGALTVLSGSPIVAIYSTYKNVASSYYKFISNCKTAYEQDKADGVIDNYITRVIPAHTATEWNPYPPNSYQGAMF